MVQICVSCNNQNSHLAEGGPQEPQFVESNNVSSLYPREQISLQPATSHQQNTMQVAPSHPSPFVATKKPVSSESAMSVRYKVSFE